MTIPTLTPADTGMITAIAFKAFIILADSMPPPPEDCGYWMRWFYDAVQKAASNGLKVGATRSVATPSVTSLASTWKPMDQEERPDRPPEVPPAKP